MSPDIKHRFHSTIRSNTKYKSITLHIVKLAEDASTLAVEKLLSLRNVPDPILLEREQQEQQVILEQLRIQHSELRKTEVLKAMTDSLAGERCYIDAYQQRRDNTARDILEAEINSNEQINRILWCNDRDRSGVVEGIMHDEQLQRAAVGSLIENNDARSWALVEQVRLVEAQLLRVTRLELDRKQLSVDVHLVSNKHLCAL